MIYNVRMYAPVLLYSVLNIYIYICTYFILIHTIRMKLMQTYVNTYYTRF